MLRKKTQDERSRFCSTSNKFHIYFWFFNLFCCDIYVRTRLSIFRDKLIRRYCMGKKLQLINHPCNLSQYFTFHQIGEIVTLCNGLRGFGEIFYGTYWGEWKYNVKKHLACLFVFFIKKLIPSPSNFSSSS